MCPNGETCINTDGSFFCQKPCDGLVEELDVVSGKLNIFIIDSLEKPIEILRINKRNVM